MKIQWLGHNCFLLTSRKGSTLLLDPYSHSVKLDFPEIAADVVVISHEHPENNAVWRVDGSPIVIKSTSEFPCEHEITVARTQEAFAFKGTPAHHDDVRGRRRGPNTIFSWVINRIRVCFLGDLGHVLDDKQILAIGPVDLLFIPIGGRGVTIGPKEATVVVDQLHPSLIVPMTYKNPAVPWELEPIDAFLSLMNRVEALPGDSYECTAVPPGAKVLVFQLPDRTLSAKGEGGTDQ